MFNETQLFLLSCDFIQDTCMCNLHKSMYIITKGQLLINAVSSDQISDTNCKSRQRSCTVLLINKLL